MICFADCFILRCTSWKDRRVAIPFFEEQRLDQLGERQTELLKVLGSLLGLLIFSIDLIDVLTSRPWVQTKSGRMIAMFESAFHGLDSVATSVVLYACI